MTEQEKFFKFLREVISYGLAGFVTGLAFIVILFIWASLTP